MDIERLFKMSTRQRSQTTRQVCRRIEEETNVSNIYMLYIESEVISSYTLSLLCSCVEM